MLDQGRPPEPLRTIQFRPGRCCALLGIDISNQQIARILTALEITIAPPPAAPASTITATIPPFRPDLTREVDLIEEVARIHGFEHIPMHPRMSVQVRHPQESERAVRELARILTGAGFYETVTFSFISRQHAQSFLAPGVGIIAVDDERRRQEPALRPSIIPGLLACRRANQNAGAEADQGAGPDAPGIRLFEIASTFAELSTQHPEPAIQNPARSTQQAARSATPSIPGILERRALTLLLDIPGSTKGRQPSIDQRQRAIRILRGTLEAAARALTGHTIELIPAAPEIPAFDPSAFAHITLRGRRIGSLGLITPETLGRFDLDIPVAAAELELDPLIAPFPPRSRIQLLPAFPGIERDLSLIVSEDIRWEQLRALVDRANLDRLEDLAFVGSYRGKQIGPGKKSLTLRLRFRDPARTLRHEEVDPQVATLIDLASKQLGATLRT
jgi:phenylalanyl-tRNA synthetase beta chain